MYYNYLTQVKDLILEARKFYTFDGWCTDYVELTQDYSKLFKMLSLFEFEPEKRSKMHKRRVDMLEELSKELNPQFYLLVSTSTPFSCNKSHPTGSCVNTGKN